MLKIIIEVTIVCFIYILNTYNYQIMGNQAIELFPSKIRGFVYGIIVNFGRMARSLNPIYAFYSA